MTGIQNMQYTLQLNAWIHKLFCSKSIKFMHFRECSLKHIFTSDCRKFLLLCCKIAKTHVYLSWLIVEMQNSCMANFQNKSIYCNRLCNYAVLLMSIREILCFFWQLVSEVQHFSPFTDNFWNWVIFFSIVLHKHIIILPYICKTNASFKFISETFNIFSDWSCAFTINQQNSNFFLD